jgi:hypothetical protein
MSERFGVIRNTQAEFRPCLFPAISKTKHQIESVSGMPYKRRRITITMNQFVQGEATILGVTTVKAGFHQLDTLALNGSEADALLLHR